jgi:homoserine dehydrogenase
MKKIQIGLFGLGTVGSGVVKIIEEEKDLIKQKTNIDISVKSIVVKNLSKKRDIDTSKYKISDNPKLIIDDPEIDIVVEVMGGIESAYDVITQSIKKGKHVVTANKALLAENWKEIFELVEKNHIKINYEASVAASIPIIKNLEVSLVADNFSQIKGIINGTSNFILTKMAQDSMDFKEALKLAQDKGFAEADPTFDISGKDAAQKLLILSNTAFNTNMTFYDIYLEGIENISYVDIKYADELGYIIKPLAQSVLVKNEIFSSVYPALIDKDHPFSSVNNEMNAVMITGERIGDQIYIGKGAGQMPTACVVVSDIIDLIRRQEMITIPIKNNPADFGSKQGEYYVRFSVEDKPGVMAEIARILAKNDLSIKSLIQKQNGTKATNVVMVLHKSVERNVQIAIQEIDTKPFIQNKTVVLHIEH